MVLRGLPRRTYLAHSVGMAPGRLCRPAWSTLGDRWTCVSVMLILLSGAMIAPARALDHGRVTVALDTPLGRLVGTRRTENYQVGEGSITDTVDQFFGVPYAMPPVGKLRFKPPRPMGPWSGVRNATQFGAVCPQRTYYRATAARLQREDCLSLNVYTPYTSETSQNDVMYPVMLFIHGGSYEEGTGNRYDGFVLAQNGVVVVTINYRLGVLGYMTSGDDLLPGNYGLLDQIEAIRWTRMNIASFRGDPKKITIFGNSAGASSVGLLLMSPLARGLFAGAIIQSGSPLAFWSVYNDTVDFPQFLRHVAMLVGCPKDRSMADVIYCLRKVPFEKFNENHWKFDRIVPSRCNFKPRVDGKAIPENPRHLAVKGEIQHLPVMIGTVKDEWTRSMGWFMTDLRKTLPDIDTNFSDGMDRTLFKSGIDHVITQRFWWPVQLADVIKYEYTDWRQPEDPYSNRRNYYQMMSDLAMVAPTVEFARKLSNHSIPVYMYTFNHHPRQASPEWWGVHHSMELDFLFGAPFHGFNTQTDQYQNYTEVDRAVSRRVLKIWTDFAKYGKPLNPLDGGEVWDRMDQSVLNHLHIDEKGLSLKYNLRSNKVAFWNVLVPTLLKQYASDVTITGKGCKQNGEFWVLLALCGVLIACVVLLGALLCRQNQQQRADRKYKIDNAVKS